MANDDHKHSAQFDASLPLPDEAMIHKDSDIAATPTKENPAVELVRRRVDEAYNNAPPAEAEFQTTSIQPSSARMSTHQQFIDELVNSGKSLPQIQTEWHEYYAALPDDEKHAVWKEFYDQQQGPKKVKAKKPAKKPHKAVPHTQLSHNETKARESLTKIKKPGRAKRRAPKARAGASPFRSLAFGLSIGLIVLFIFMFSFFNERVIAPFIQPSRLVTNTPIISTGNEIGPNPEVIIPKINVEIPVVYGINTISEAAIDQGLENGVVHYADTAVPGQNGNVVIVGHSSNNLFNSGNYKFAFVLLSRLDIGDTFYLQKDGKRYTYQIYQKEIVKPTDVSVLGPNSKTATATLITCDPPGTSANRLVVVGEQISPDPSANQASSSSNNQAATPQIIPGNSPSLWSRFTKWFEG